MLSPEVGLEPRGRLGIFANTCPEWLITLHGSVSQSIEVVTVYANLGIFLLFFLLTVNRKKFLKNFSFLLFSLFSVNRKNFFFFFFVKFI